MGNEEEKKDEIIINDEDDQETSQLKITKVITKTNDNKVGADLMFVDVINTPKDIVEQPLQLTRNVAPAPPTRYLFDSIIKSVNFCNEIFVDSPPAAPSTNLLTKKQSMLLVSGYIRNNFKTKRVPNDIMGFFVVFVSTKFAITYEETLDILFNKECCIGVYDFESSQWQSAVYVDNWDKSKRILIRYTNMDKWSGSGKFKIIKDFPANYLIEDGERFKASKSDLMIYSGLSKKKIDEWVQRENIKN